MKLATPETAELARKPSFAAKSTCVIQPLLAMRLHLDRIFTLALVPQEQLEMDSINAKTTLPSVNLAAVVAKCVFSDQMGRESVSALKDMKQMQMEVAQM